MRLRRLVVADPVDKVARQIADGCERLAEERVISTTGAQTIDVASALRPEMVILSLELSSPEAVEVVGELHRFLPETFTVVSFREMAVPTVERLAKLSVDDFMPQPLDLTAVFRAASRRFGVGFRRHDRHTISLDMVRADGVLIGRTLDLSEGGLRFAAIHPLAVDDSILVDLVLPSDKPLRVRCRILDVQGRPPLQVTARAQFENLRGREHGRLAAYLASLAPEAQELTSR
jgi:ActR/RegA family two-component response regulator